MPILTEFVPRENVDNSCLFTIVLFHFEFAKFWSKIATLVGILQVSYSAGVAIGAASLKSYKCLLVDLRASIL